MLLVKSASYSCSSLRFLIRFLSNFEIAEAAKQRNNTESPSIEDWLVKWRKRRKKIEDKDKATLGTEEDNTYTLPPGLPHVTVLPPSLRPPPPGGYPNHSRVEWG
jgi:U11/U12 small nuclear ribonucleoprotein SNRNP20